MVAVIDIAGRKIGPGHSGFIIAEAGVNHNGSLDMARGLSLAQQNMPQYDCRGS
jgi:sialic acid synthase SpsE